MEQEGKVDDSVEVETPLSKVQRLKRELLELAGAAGPGKTAKETEHKQAVAELRASISQKAKAQGLGMAKDVSHECKDPRKSRWVFRTLLLPIFQLLFELLICDPDDYNLSERDDVKVSLPAILAVVVCKMLVADVQNGSADVKGCKALLKKHDAERASDEDFLEAIANDAVLMTKLKAIADSLWGGDAQDFSGLAKEVAVYTTKMDEWNVKNSEWIVGTEAAMPKNAAAAAAAAAAGTGTRK